MGGDCSPNKDAVADRIAIPPQELPVLRRVVSFAAFMASGTLTAPGCSASDGIYCVSSLTIRVDTHNGRHRHRLGSVP